MEVRIANNLSLEKKGSCLPYKTFHIYWAKIGTKFAFVS